MEVLTDAFNKDDSLRTDLIALLAHWENLGLTVAAGVTDEDMAFDMVAGTLVAYIDRFRQFIDHQKKERHDRMYTYVLQIARRWRVRLKKGSPVPMFGP